uniref:Uncharacterized protein n=1 Tax=Tetranychus urticae TaxID=32264 RepID=T1KYA9_TETUR
MVKSIIRAHHILHTPLILTKCHKIFNRRNYYLQSRCIHHLVATLFHLYLLTL